MGQFSANDINTTEFLQKCELEILREFVRICDKHKLNYFIAAGTLLGSVRHGGFIPWDDDVDIGMYRGDYESFIQIAEYELNYPYKIHTFTNCHNHHYLFAHMIDERYTVRRLGSMDERIENVWIDIFPYDGLPKGMLKSSIVYLRLLFYRFCYHMAYFDKINIAREDRVIWQRILLRALLVVHSFIRFDKRKWSNKIDKLLKKTITRCYDNYMAII